MEEKIAVYGMDRQIQVTEDQRRLVKSIVFPGCSDDEMGLYLFECTRRGVHPLDRLIFPIKRSDKEGEKRVTFQASVDYLRAEAADTGEYDGQDEAVFGASDASGFPESASVAVYKKGISRPTIGTARWREFYPGEKMGFMWRKMPFHMLAKCAEVLALRKAFPKRLAGLYIAEEMQSVSTKPPLKEPAKKSDGDPTKISEAQAKRFFAIAKGAGKTDVEIKAHLKEVLNIEHTADIPKDKYDAIVKWGETKVERQPGDEA
jgi:phage recombination protein Bet